MADYFSGIKHITPTYPVKPAQPVPKDRQTDRRKKEPRKKPEQEPTEREDGEHGSTIDEHV
jgi:hypothetical protein